MNKTKLSTQAYKGTTDIYPTEMITKNYLFDTWRKVANEFGYEEYDTPILEESLLYKVKSGEELAGKQLFSFTDKAGREVSLRPEMTPSLARIVAAKRNELTFPIRWFNIGKFYRYEKPQRGRTREFVQLNIDILGVSTVEAEIEIIQFVMKVMDELKAKKKTFELRISNRYLFDYLADSILKLDDEKKSMLAKAIDNYLKMEKKDFNEYLAEIGLDGDQRAEINEYLNWELKDLESIRDSSRGANELLTLFEYANRLGIKNIKFAPYIMRGLAYYTGTVIEMFDIGSKENPRALFGGGRYDDLLDIFNQEKIPAFGLGWGDVTTIDYLKTYDLLPSSKTNTKVFVTLMDTPLYDKTAELAKYLREEGINTQMQLTTVRLGKQLQYADRKAIPWTVIMGEDEIKEGIVQLKSMYTKEVFRIKKEDIIDKIS